MVLRDRGQPPSGVVAGLRRERSVAAEVTHEHVVLRTQLVVGHQGRRAGLGEQRAGHDAEPREHGQAGKGEQQHTSTRCPDSVGHGLRVGGYGDAMLRRACVLVAAVVLPVAGCAAAVPEGKQWVVDTSAWQGSPQCDERPCALDAYPARDLDDETAVRGALVDGVTVRVHCFVPTPAPQQDPRGREAYRWYLVGVGDALVWAPDLALTGDPDLRQDPAAQGHLATGVELCHSGVPNR